MLPRGMLYVATWHLACGALQRRSSRPLRRVPTSSLRCAHIRRGSKQHSHTQHATDDVQHATSVQSAVIASPRRVGANRDAALHLRAGCRHCSASDLAGRVAPVTASHRQERERAAESDRLALRIEPLTCDGTRTAQTRRRCGVMPLARCNRIAQPCSTQHAARNLQQILHRMP